MTERDFKDIFICWYQYTRTISYLAEMMDEEYNLFVEYLRKLITAS